MLRFEYTDRKHMEDITCRDCSKRRNCKKIAIYKSQHQKERTEICNDFVMTPRGNPQVVMPDCDCRMLLHQLMIASCSSETIIRQHMIDGLCPTRGFDLERPSIEECKMFIDVIKAFSAHIFEFKEMYENCRKDLNDLIQTVIRVEEDKVMVYIPNEEKTVSSIKLLREGLKKVVDSSEYHFEERGRDELFLKEVPSLPRKTTE